MDTGTIPSPVPLTIVNNHPGAGTGTSNSSVSLSIFIIVAIVVIAIISILFIHRLIRLFFCHLHESSYRLSIPRAGGNANTTNSRALSEREKSNLIDSLPVFTLASSMAKLPKSSPDCAVCYDPFLPDAELRLLPACRHAFHKSCVDKWLKSNPSCPLCRLPITCPHPPLPDLSSGSFRLEIGNVSRRRSDLDNQDPNQIRPVMTPTNLRTFSLDSHDYFIEEEVEIVPPPVGKQEKREIEISDCVPPRLPPPQPPSPPPLPPPPPPPEPIEDRTREEPVRGWLHEYLDRLSTSASSSFNSIKFPSQRWSERWSGRWSQRSSQRFDSGGGGEPPPETWLWDIEAGQSDEVGGLFAVYRWVTGL